MDKKIDDLLKLMEKHNLQEIEVKEGSDAIRLVKPNHFSTAPSWIAPTLPNHPPPTASKPEKVVPSDSDSTTELAPNLTEIRSPFVGVFYSAPAPDESEFVVENQKVRKGQTLCIVEAMKLMNEIEAEKSGTIRKVLVENEQPIEFDQPIFLIEHDV